jgi:hypothetical protein
MVLWVIASLRRRLDVTRGKKGSVSPPPIKKSLQHPSSSTDQGPDSHPPLLFVLPTSSRDDDERNLGQTSSTSDTSGSDKAVRYHADQSYSDSDVASYDRAGLGESHNYCTAILQKDDEWSFAADSCSSSLPTYYTDPKLHLNSVLERDTVATSTASHYSDPTLMLKGQGASVGDTASTSSKCNFESAVASSKSHPTPHTNAATTFLHDKHTMALELIRTADAAQRNGRHEAAYSTYRLAAAWLEPLVFTGSVIAAVRAAECCCAMAMCNKRTQHRCSKDTIKCWRRARLLFGAAREGVKVTVNNHQAPLVIRDLDFEGKQYDQPLCLDALILECIQSEIAVCNSGGMGSNSDDYYGQEILHELLKISKYRSLDVVRGWVIDGVRFLPLTKEQFLIQLEKTLRTLGRLYKERALILPETLIAQYNRAVAVLRDELVRCQSNSYRSFEALESLVDVYLERQEFYRAKEALLENIQAMTTCKVRNTKILYVLYMIAAALERKCDLSDALECYVQIFYTCCEYFGTTNLSVAKALINIARVKVALDGMRAFQECVDLNSAANAIYSLYIDVDQKVVSSESSIVSPSELPAIVRRQGERSCLNRPIEEFSCDCQSVRDFGSGFETERQKQLHFLRSIQSGDEDIQSVANNFGAENELRQRMELSVPGACGCDTSVSASSVTGLSSDDIFTVVSGLTFSTSKGDTVRLTVAAEQARIGTDIRGSKTRVVVGAGNPGASALGKNDVIVEGKKFKQRFGFQVLERVLTKKREG